MSTGKKSCNGDKVSLKLTKKYTLKKYTNMEFLKNFNGIKFIGNGKVYNGYLNQEQTWKEYQQWAEKNIY